MPQEDESRYAVPGPESHESEDTLSPDEKDEQPDAVPPPAPPKTPYPKRSRPDELLKRDGRA
jgi:hypothetical protein